MRHLADLASLLSAGTMQAFQGSAGPTSQQPENHSLLQQQQQQQQQPEGGQQHGHQQQPWSGQVLILAFVKS